MAKKSKGTLPSRQGQLNLRSRRLSKGLTLEQIAENTKISIRFLRAIEAEEFDKLPGGIFNTSYLRQYASAIGFDEADLLTYYAEQIKPSEQDGEALERRPNRGIMRWFRESLVAGR